MLLSLLSLMGIQATAQEVKYFKSDAFGNLYGELAENEIPINDYWVSTEKQKLLELRKIYSGTGLIGVHTAEFNANGSISRETQFIDDMLSLERVFNDDGTISSEREFIPGGAVREIIYRHKNRKIIEKEITDEQGVKSSVGYVYGFDGRLLEARESGSSSSGAGASYANETSDWVKSSTGFIVTKYNSDGKMAGREYFFNQKLQTIEEFSYENERIMHKKTSIPAALTIIEVRFNLTGQAQTEETFIDAKLVEKSEFEYFADMSLKKKITRAEGTVALIEVFKNDADAGETEKHYENGVLTMVIERKSKEDYFIETYDSGLLVVTVFFLDGRKSKEQFWKNGSLIKERIFP